MKTKFGYADVYCKEEEFIDDFGELDCKEYALIDYIEVYEEYRQEGHGREILMGAIKEAKKLNDIVKIIAHEYDSNVISISDLVKFYESCGFEVDSTCENGNVIMVLR
jgi:GNAT superfamily N-acetyltransferase